jgi:tRNA-2-methylthio-N6-dimethylallyladenosine synthase
MNERDSESLAALLTARGYVPAAREATADIVIVNTCSVRAKAEDKALGKLGLLAAAKRDTPGRLVGAVGCMVERMGTDLLRRVPALDFAIGTHRLTRLPAVLDAVRTGAGPLVETGECDVRDAGLSEHRVSGPRAYVTVLLGCDRRCRYCVVPQVRGREWSRPAADVLREVEDLARRGVREVTLLGQSVMAYGRANPVWEPGVASALGLAEPFPRLLEAVSGVPGIGRVRFTSGHPSGCTPELARAMAALPAVCEHLHLPVQSGSDRVLERMGRGYSADAYLAAVARLRAAVPGLAVTTDVIVGFPGETAEDFECTRRLMEQAGFDNAFIFKYSPRERTAAADWPDDVPDAEKQRRNQVLLADQNRRSLAIHRALEGSEQEVLAEGPSPRNARRWWGRTRTNTIVLFDRPRGVRPGDLVWIRIERARPQTLYGRPAGQVGERAPGGARREDGSER